MTTRRAVLWTFPAVAAGLALGWVWLAILAAPADYLIFIDWWTYAFGTDRVLAGDSLYLPRQLDGPYHLPDVTPEGYVYPPPSALLFLPFSVGQLGLAAWVLFNVAAFFSGLAAVLRRELGTVGPFSLGFALLGLLVVVPLPGGEVAAPFPNGVGSANVNVALAGLLGWTWAAGSRRGWVPWLAGVAGVFKVFPGALALWAARTHGWRSLAVAGAVGAALVAVTLPVLGLDEWGRFVRALANAQPTCDDGRLSIACATQAVLGPELAELAGFAVGATLLLLAVAVRAEYPAFVLLTLGMLAPIADGHQHYLLFVYVLVVVGVARLAAQRRRARIPAAAGSAG